MADPQVTPEQEVEHALSRIRSFAYQQKLTGDQIIAVFETGMFACGRANPALLNRVCEQVSAPAEAKAA